MDWRWLGHGVPAISCMRDEGKRGKAKGGRDNESRGGLEDKERNGRG